MEINKQILSSGWLWCVPWTYTCERYTHSHRLTDRYTHTHTRVVVIPVFPLRALLHMHEAQAMCAAAHRQLGLSGQGRCGRESCCVSVWVCQPLPLSTLYLSDWATASHTQSETHKHTGLCTSTHRLGSVHAHPNTYSDPDTLYLMFWAVMMTGIKIEKHIKGTWG